MDARQELLNFVYQNSEMGAISIDRLAEYTSDERFQKALRDQKREYLSINAAARDALCRTGCDEKGLGALSKVKTYLMIDMQSIMDRTTAHLAEMMVIGSTMGIIDAKKNLRRYEGEDLGEAQSLMNTLCDLEERNVETMKTFL
ncbi:MAG: hypothetical protein IKT43_02385 [Clostridia bacterium]|nr:hypothetical protein [Clostridia bacterium]